MSSPMSDHRQRCAKPHQKAVFSLRVVSYPYIAGFTSWGFPYGVTGEELGETPPWIEEEEKKEQMPASKRATAEWGQEDLPF